MKAYCRDCQQLVEVMVTENEDMHVIHNNPIIYQKIAGFCPICKKKLDIEEFNEENSNRILEEMNMFDSLNPFSE